MSVLIDVGNTNLKIYHTKNNKIVGREILSWKIFDKDSFIPRLQNAKKIAIVSVVPEKLKSLQDLMATAGVQALVAGEQLKFQLKIKVDEPDKVGRDRLVSATAAYQMQKGPVIVVDLGTALTVDLVSKKGEFLGGIIAPGLPACALGLESSAPLLKGYGVVGELKVPGKNTGEAIRGGIACLVAGGIEKAVSCLREVEPEATILGTGGDFDRIKDFLSFAVSYEADLLPLGLMELMKSHG